MISLNDSAKYELEDLFVQQAIFIKNIDFDNCETYRYFPLQINRYWYTQIYINILQFRIVNYFRRDQTTIFCFATQRA